MGGTEGGSKVMVGEGTRGGRERRREGADLEGGREQGDGGRGNKGREGESKGRERGSNDATHARSVSGGRGG